MVWNYYPMLHCKYQPLFSILLKVVQEIHPQIGASCFVGILYPSSFTTLSIYLTICVVYFASNYKGNSLSHFFCNTFHWFRIWLHFPMIFLYVLFCHFLKLSTPCYIHKSILIWVIQSFMHMCFFPLWQERALSDCIV